jgi:hypothetical protein
MNLPDVIAHRDHHHPALRVLKGIAGLAALGGAAFLAMRLWHRIQDRRIAAAGAQSSSLPVHPVDGVYGADTEGPLAPNSESPVARETEDGIGV